MFYRGAEKKTVRLELAAFPIPQVPATAAELAEVIRKGYAEVNAELAGMFEGVSEAEAEHHPAPEAWNVKEIVAHLIACERDFQSWVSDMLNDNVINDWLEFRPNVLPRLRVMVTRFGTLSALMDELKHSQDETVALLAALPETFVARKHLYRRVATWMLDTVPLHYRGEHLGAMQAAIGSARQEK